MRSNIIFISGRNLFVLLFILLFTQGFCQSSQDKKKFTSKMISFPNDYSDDDTCAVYYNSKEDFNAKKAKTVFFWKDPDKLKKDPYFYTHILLEEMNGYARTEFGEHLKRKGILDTTDESDYNIRRLEIDILLKKLSATSIGSSKTEFCYDFTLQFNISTKLNSEFYSFIARKKTPFTGRDRFTKGFSKAEGQKNMEKYADSIITTMYEEIFSDKTIAKIQGKIDSTLQSRLNAPPLNLGSLKTGVSDVSDCVNSVITIKQESGYASGCIISADGYIITNYNVVEKAKEVEIILNDGKTKTAKVVRTNPEEDFALLKMDGNDYKPLYINAGAAYKMGDDIFTVGTTGGGDLGQTVSKGIISSVRKLRGKDYIQMDVKINRGSHGGAVLNKNGDLIGIVYGKITGRNVESLSFALPAKKVLTYLVLVYK
jgi:S1-C subfamily serine protease